VESGEGIERSMKSCGELKKKLCGIR